MSIKPLRSWDIDAHQRFSRSHHHDPSALATFQYFSFRTSWYCYLMQYPTKYKFMAWGVILQDHIHIEYCRSSFIELIYIFVVIIASALAFQGTVFRSDGNIRPMHWSIKDFSSSSSKARLSTIPNQGHTRSSPMLMNRGTMPSKLTTFQFNVRNFGALKYLTDSLQAGSRKSLLIKFGEVPVSSRLAMVTKAFDVTPIET